MAAASMVALYATVSRRFAERLQRGKANLANLRRRKPLDSPSDECIEIEDRLTPPMSAQEVVLCISLSQDKRTLRERIVPIMDAVCITYRIPRTWLENAAWRKVSDQEILTACISHLDDVMPPCGGFTMRDSIEQGVRNRDLRWISPFYLRALEASKSNQPSGIPPG